VLLALVVLFIVAFWGLAVLWGLAVIAGLFAVSTLVCVGVGRAISLADAQAEQERPRD
jgi:hypothetical protein